MTTDISSQNKDRSQISSSGKPPILSPHLQVWKFTVTMASSITHRACGAALYAGTAILAIWLYATANNPGLYNLISDFLGSPLGILLLAGYVWALYFHLFKGILHLVWDSGRAFEFEVAKRLSFMIFLGATLMMLVTVLVGLSIAGIL